MTDYAVANTSVTESGCGDPSDYSGIESKCRAFPSCGDDALSFFYNLLASGAVNRFTVVIDRDVRDRVEDGSFLDYDGDVSGRC